MYNLDEFWDKLVSLGVSEETLETVTCLNGYSLETLQSILYVRFGYRLFAQLSESETFGSEAESEED